MLLRKRNMLLNNRQETKPVVRVMEHRIPEKRVIIVVEYTTADGTFLIKRNDVPQQRITRSGRDNAAFCEEVLSGYLDIIVVSMLLNSKAREPEMAAKQCEGVINAGRLQLEKLFKSMEPLR